MFHDSEVSQTRLQVTVSTQGQKSDTVGVAGTGPSSRTTSSPPGQDAVPPGLEPHIPVSGEKGARGTQAPPPAPETPGGPLQREGGLAHLLHLLQECHDVGPQLLQLLLGLTQLSLGGAQALLRSLGPRVGTALVGMAQVLEPDFILLEVLFLLEEKPAVSAWAHKGPQGPSRQALVSPAGSAPGSSV